MRAGRGTELMRRGKTPLQPGPLSAPSLSGQRISTRQEPEHTPASCRAAPAGWSHCGWAGARRVRSPLSFQQ